MQCDAEDSCGASRPPPRSLRRCCAGNPNTEPPTMGLGRGWRCVRQRPFASTGGPLKCDPEKDKTWEMWNDGTRPLMKDPGGPLAGNPHQLPKTTSWKHSPDPLTLGEERGSRESLRLEKAVRRFMWMRNCESKQSESIQVALPCLTNHLLKIFAKRNQW